MSNVVASDSVGTGGCSPARRTRPAKSGPGSSHGLKYGSVTGDTLVGPPRASARSWPLLPALLDVRLHEVLGVGLEDLVDLVEEVVELGLELLARLGRGGGIDDLVVLLG